MGMGVIMHDGHDFDGFLIIYRCMCFSVLVTEYPKGLLDQLWIPYRNIYNITNQDVTVVNE